jgi:hypothetical protein
MRNYIDLLNPRRDTFTQEELADYFVSPRHYKKFGVVDARWAIPGEWVATFLDGGKFETANRAGSDDVVVKNPGGEHYIISADKFRKRYRGDDLDQDYQSYRAVGTTYAVEWTEPPAQFKAAWGEMMIIDHGDMLCSPTRVPDGDLYRIEYNAFAETYKEIEDDK